MWLDTTAPAVVNPLDIDLDIEMKTIAGRSGATALIFSSTLEAGAKVVSTKIIISLFVFFL